MKQTCTEPRRIDPVAEGEAPSDKQDRNVIPVARHELGGRCDVHHLQGGGKRRREILTDPLDHVVCLFAEAAACLGVERELDPS